MRTCLVCGYVCRCDGSKNKHSSRTTRPSASGDRIGQAGDNWMWCRVDKALI